jgi:hypothetical protein
MKPNNDIDLFFKNILKNDRRGIVPDAGVENRLNYYYMLKHSSRKLYANSFFNFNWLNIKSLGLKTGLVSVCLIGMLFLVKVNNSQNITNTLDSSRVYSAASDSNFWPKDTCQ